MPDSTNAITIEILTPEKPFLTTETTLVVVPGTEGDIGAMIGCAPVVCELRAGVLALFDDSLSPTERFFLSEGTAWITEARVSVLTRDIVVLDRLDLSAVNAMLKTAEEAQDRESDKETDKKIDILRAKQLALENQPYAG